MQMNKFTCLKSLDENKFYLEFLMNFKYENLFRISLYQSAYVYIHQLYLYNILKFKIFFFEYMQI